MATDRLPLRDGPIVSADVVAWLLAAADRGLVFTPTPAGRLRVTPHPAPGTPDDLYCRAHRDELLVLVRYCEAVTSWPLDRSGTPWQVQAVRSLPAPAAVEAPEPAQSEPVEVPLWP